MYRVFCFRLAWNAHALLVTLTHSHTPSSDRYVDPLVIWATLGEDISCLILPWQLRENVAGNSCYDLSVGFIKKTKQSPI